MSKTEKEIILHISLDLLRWTIIICLGLFLCKSVYNKGFEYTYNSGFWNNITESERYKGE